MSKPSYLSSTLSLAFILSLVSVFALIILAIIVAVYYPEAYKLASDNELLAWIILMAYLGYLNNIMGAYLWGRNAPTKPETENKTPETSYKV